MATGLVIPVISPAAARNAADDTWNNVDRVVAVGDVHGDYEQYLAVLKSAGLVDDVGHWIGGKTHLVQTGDVLDRGPDSRQVLDSLIRLEQEAQSAGGAVHALIGNHEAMNVIGDFRYTSAGEYAAFRDENSEKVRDAAYQKEGGRQDRAAWDAKHPLGFFEHRAAFSPSGTYGKWIASHNAVIKVDNTIFLHGGISPRYLAGKLHQINEEVRTRLNAKEPSEILTAQDSPLWYRGLAQGDEKALETHVARILHSFGVERIVVGHTYADAAITPRFHGQVILIDIGLSRVYDNVGKVGCLVIEHGQPYALHRETRLELPSDSGQDLLRYLRQAAALDPPPSPLLKRIAILETAR